jgi:hypothetical protein
MITSAQMDKFRLGLENRCLVTVRGVPFEFRPLTIAEVADTTTTSMSAFNRMLPEQKHSINESRVMAICTLVKASELKPGTPGVTEDTLNMLTPDELSYVYREYNHMVAMCNPMIETIPDDELLGLAEELKKNPNLLTELSSLRQLNLVRFLLTKDSSPQDK